MEDAESIIVVKLAAHVLQRVGPSVRAQIVFLVGVVFRGSDFENGSNARPVDRLAVPVSRPASAVYTDERVEVR